MVESSTLLLVSGLAFVSTLGTPALAQYLMNRQRQRERAEDRLDREAVAKEVKTVQKTLADSTTATTNKLDGLHNGQVIIHALVNSNMTSAMQAELNASVRDLASLREIVDLKKVAGREPNLEALTAINVAAARVLELTAALQDRLKEPEPVKKV